jgi:high-affinity Fe2+/Pb2+ permease
MNPNDATSEWIWAIIIGIIIVLVFVFVIMPVGCKSLPLPVKGWPDICVSFR